MPTRASTSSLLRMFSTWPRTVRGLT
jgi:hypothetical protein